MPLRTRFYNARILTMKDFDVFSGEVWIEDNKIIYVGKEKASTFCFDREIDVHQNLIMPGFINAHTHSGMTFLRSMADDMPLQQWLKERVFPIEEKLTQEDIYFFSKLAILEYLTSGITTNFDMYLNPEELEYEFLDYLVPLKNIIDVTDTQEIGSIIILKNGMSVHVEETVEHVNFMIYMLTMSWWDRLKFRFSNFFAKK